jgi:twitching motility protein PilT
MSILAEVLTKAVELKASDIHLKVGEEPVYRVSGDLVKGEFDKLTDETMLAIARDIIPQHLVEKFEEEREVDFSVQEDGVGRFRVNVFVSQGLPTIAMRHVKSRIPTFEDLRLPPQVSKLVHLERGILIVSGTTGSGKSSTLAALIGAINRTYRYRIITIEDPVEYVFDDEQSIVSQREVGLDTLAFHNALKHLMRQDPDVVLIGEMRDTTSIQTAILAAETGHLVMSTLHAGDASLAVPRMLDVFPASEHEQIRMALAANLCAVLAQRLIPDTQGGVVPAVEIMINTPTVRKLMEKNLLEVLPSAIATGKEDGMQSFNQAVYTLIKAGLITEKEGMAHATNPESLRMNLQGIFLDEDSRILNI